jgi:hypothetical protein
LAARTGEEVIGHASGTVELSQKFQVSSSRFQVKAINLKPETWNLKLAYAGAAEPRLAHQGRLMPPSTRRAAPVI